MREEWRKGEVHLPPGNPGSGTGPESRRYLRLFPIWSLVSGRQFKVYKHNITAIKQDSNVVYE